MSDLRQRVPGHSLIEQLLREWDLGNIHPGSAPGEVVIDDEARGWYLGVHGERWVATRLAMLGPEHTVLHSVPVGRGDSDIDHVVIGPTGVFTINTKYSPGKRIWFAGYGVYVGQREEKHFIRNLDFEVRRASERLSRAVGAPIRVTGLLVFVDPAHMNRKAPPGDGTIDLRVISDAELLSAISGPTVYTPEQVAQLTAAATRAETWHDAPYDSTIGSHIAREFIALEEAVGPVTLPSIQPKATSKRLAPGATSKPVEPARNWSGRDPARRRPQKRQNRRLQRAIESVAIFVLFGIGGWWLTSPEGQTFVTGIFTR